MLRFTARILLTALLILSFLPLNVNANLDPVETRYMRSDTQTINGVTAYKLLTERSSSYVSRRLISWSSSNYLYISIYKVTQAGVSTLITSGAYVYGSGYGLEPATVDVPETALDYYDAVKVEVVYYDPNYGDSVIATFITEQLGASQLNSATWTVYYYVYKSGSTYYFRFGTSTYDSKITNFSWTAGSPPTKTWHDITSWQFNITTKQWNPLSTLTFNVLTRKWQSIATLNFNILTKQWNLLDMLTFNVPTKKWNFLDALNFNVYTKTWHPTSQLTWQIITKAWHTIDWITFYLVQTVVSVPTLFVGLAFFFAIIVLIFLLGEK